MRKSVVSCPFAVLLMLSISAAASCAQSVPDQTATPVKGMENGRLVEIKPLDGTVYHVQGVDLDADHIWVTSVNGRARKGYLHQFNRATGKFEREVDVTDGPRFHPGGFSLYKDSLWIPVAEYKPHSSAVLVELDKNTLAVKRKIAVADHVGCLAVTGDNLIAGNWDSAQLYVLDMEGKQLRVMDNPSKTSYQDMKFAEGYLVGSGNFSRGGSVDWYAWPLMKPVRRLHSGFTDKGKLYTNEGMAVKGKDLYFVAEDGPTRLFHFVITTP